MDIDLGDSKLRLVNVYLPNIEAERKVFINGLQGYLMTSREIILGGDFNFVEDLNLDKMGGNLDRGDIGSDNMSVLKRDFYLVDAFRTKYRRKREFSFRAGPIHCRLDRFYVSDTLLQWVDTVRHTPCTVSDHYFVDLYFKDLDTSKMQYGPGYWKCNVAVLDNFEFKQDMENLWK